MCLVAGILIAAPIYSAPSLGAKLQGKILLAVEDKGKTYYVHTDGNRYLITKATAQKVFEKLALGITNENLKQIPLKELQVEEDKCKPEIIYKETECDNSNYEKILELNKEIVSLKNKNTELSESLGVINDKTLAEESLEKEYGLKINELEKQMLELSAKNRNAEELMKQKYPAMSSGGLVYMIEAFKKDITKQYQELEAQVSSLRNELNKKLLEL